MNPVGSCTSPFKNGFHFKGSCGHALEARYTIFLYFTWYQTHICVFMLFFHTHTHAFVPGEYQSQCDILALGLNYSLSDLSSASVSPGDRQLNTHTHIELSLEEKLKAPWNIHAVAILSEMYITRAAASHAASQDAPDLLSWSANRILESKEK